MLPFLGDNQRLSTLTKEVATYMYLMLIGVKAFIFRSNYNVMIFLLREELFAGEKNKKMLQHRTDHSKMPCTHIMAFYGLEAHSR